MNIINFDEFENYDSKMDDPDYKFLLNLYDLINEKSYPKKNTRKFLRTAYKLVDDGEIKKNILDFFIKNESLSSKIVNEIKKKIKREKSKSGNVSWHNYNDSSCGSSSMFKSSC